MDKRDIRDMADADMQVSSRNFYRSNCKCIADSKVIKYQQERIQKLRNTVGLLVDDHRRFEGELERARAAFKKIEHFFDGERERVGSGDC
jgi:hypothetical protein